MQGILQFVFASGVVVAATQFVSGPVADWNARRQGAAELKRRAQLVHKKDDHE